MEIAESLAHLLLERYRNRRWSPGDAVPSLSELCREFSVSRTTAARIIQKLSHGGIIVCSPGERRYHFHDLPPGMDTHRSEHQGHRYLQIASALREEIEQGHHPAGGQLPASKILQRRFLCHHVTLAKALSVLERDGIVLKTGRTIRLLPAPGKAAVKGASIIIAGHQSYINVMHPSIVAFMAGAQEELRTLGWPPARTFLVQDPLAQNSPDLSGVSGFVYLTYGKETPWNRFFARHATRSLVAVNLSEQFQPRIRQSAYCALHPDNAGAGATVAQHLSSLGHRHIAFFSHVSLRFNWAKLRLDGIRRIYSSPQRMVKSFGNPPLGPRPERTPIPEPRLHPRSMAAIFPTDLSRCIDQLHEELAIYENATEALHEQFENALLHHKEITAWVCVNDYVAMLACKYLQSKGINIGKDISICGFDNHPVANQLGITSYDFDPGSFGRAAIRQFRHGHFDRGISTIHIGGYLVIRRSTEIA